VHTADPSFEYVPAGHVATVALVARTGHVYPALQLLHATDPAMLKVPGGHSKTVAFVEPAVGHT
jgi:hypothetical protein